MIEQCRLCRAYTYEWRDTDFGPVCLDEHRCDRWAEWRTRFDRLISGAATQATAVPRPPN